MESDVTPELLIKYIYHEANLDECIRVTTALHDDPQVFELYTSLLNTIQELPKVKFAPSNGTINDILGYSTNQSLEPTL